MLKNHGHADLVARWNAVDRYARLYPRLSRGHTGHDMAEAARRCHCHGTGEHWQNPRDIARQMMEGSHGSKNRN